jgi:hypothetical protein
VVLKVVADRSGSDRDLEPHSLLVEMATSVGAVALVYHEAAPGLSYDRKVDLADEEVVYGHGHREYLSDHDHPVDHADRTTEEAVTMAEEAASCAYHQCVESNLGAVVLSAWAEAVVLVLVAVQGLAVVEEHPSVQADRLAQQM